MLNFTYARDLAVALLITLSYTVSPKPDPNDSISGCQVSGKKQKILKPEH
jgi:hypothetical protein